MREARRFCDYILKKCSAAEQNKKRKSQPPKPSWVPASILGYQRKRHN